MPSNNTMYELEMRLAGEPDRFTPAAKTSSKKSLGFVVAGGSLLLLSALAVVVYFVMKSKEQAESQSASLCQSNATGVIQANYSQYGADRRRELQLSSTFDCKALWCNETELAVFLNFTMQVYNLLCSKIKSSVEELRCLNDANTRIKSMALSVCENPFNAWFPQRNSSVGNVYSQGGSDANGTWGYLDIFWENKTSAPKL